MTFLLAARCRARVCYVATLSKQAAESDDFCHIAENNVALSNWRLGSVANERHLSRQVR